MLGNISYTLVSFFYITLLTIVYFSKPRIKNIETRLYGYIVLTCMIGVCICFGTYFFMINIEQFSVLNYIFSKLYLIYLLLYTLLMNLYIINLSYGKIGENSRILSSKQFFTFWVWVFVFTLFATVVMILPINYVKDGNIVYSNGPAVDFIFMITRLAVVFWIVLLVIRHKKVNWKKYIPMIVYVLLGSIVSYIQGRHPEYLLTTSMLIFITFLMYFTIENPDVKMIEQLDFAKGQAERANKAKTDFLSSMSHEIRTPLNAIVGFSQSLKTEELSPTAIEEVDDIIEASETLLDTVNGVLDISKIEANKIEIVDSVYNFDKVFDELVALSKARLGTDKPIEFRYSKAEDTPKYLYGDYARVKQVVLNFLTNAIKYTKQGYIDFRVKNITSNGICRLIIIVEDSGIGIKKESINKLFDKFERLDNENSTIEGTGLGLAITKKLVELMHGKIIVQSIYGKGSQFMVILDQKLVAEKDIPKEEEQAKKETKEDFSDKKILIVDDNKLNLKVASRLLKPYNVQIEEIDSGFECLDLIGGGNKYDLILLDDMMPKLSGKETFKKLKDDPSFNIPVVILTANAITGMKEQYLADGFDDYLAKPIDKNELDRVIKKFLG